MLQAMRSRAAGIVAKILFLILVLAFAVWGIGDYTFLRRSDPTAITVGGVSIPLSQVQGEYQRELERMRRALGGIDPEVLRQGVFLDRVVERMVVQTLLDQTTARLKIAVGDDVVRGHIVTDPSFRGPGGGFDRFVFQQLLTESGLNEQRYVERLRQDLPRLILIDSLAAGAGVPRFLADRIYRHRFEKRAGEALFVAAAAFTDVGKPSDQDIQSLYDENKERLTTPEQRALSVIRIGPDDVAAMIKPTEEQIREEYEARAAELAVPERREIQQILVEDETTAKAAHEKIVAGTPILELARDLAKQTPDQTLLGSFSRAELLPEIANAVFALAEGGVSEPIKTGFGWHVVRVTKIEAGKQPTLAEARVQVVRELAIRLAGERAYDLAIKIDEDVGGGSSLAEAAVKHGLMATQVPAIDARGQAADGTPIALFADSPDVVARVFEMPGGAEAQLIEGRNGAWYEVRVDAVTPAQPKPLETVREDLIKYWEAQKRGEASRRQAEAILERVQKGATLEAAGAEYNSKVEKTPPRTRADNASGVAPEVVARLFTLKPGETGLAPSRAGYYVARITEITPADPATGSADVERIRDELRQQMANDLVAEFDAALRARLGVEVRRDVIQRLL